MTGGILLSDGKLSFEEFKQVVANTDIAKQMTLEALFWKGKDKKKDHISNSWCHRIVIPNVFFLSSSFLPVKFHLDE